MDQPTDPPLHSSDKMNVIVYSIIIILVFVALVCAIVLFALVSTQKPIPQSTLPAKTTTKPIAGSLSVVKPNNSTSAINELNTLQSSMDSMSANEGAGYNSFNTDMSNVSTSSTDQSSFNQL